MRQFRVERAKADVRMGGSFDRADRPYWFGLGYNMSLRRSIFSRCSWS